ncbi:hypothetical protein [Phaeocystidibacter marisrubri]|uniref:Aromatic hydrocarbon degradation protein n=1 Tax=Phaeocystidibacter marisrubri TaxID=1577780 RepID=A0A6L3ZJS6_9FLAO|nr:hypothetical protein [Phaeocystidibacter marisrubri]KAB2818194.1 hypothetical protein F8C82_07280 [Phaeocystidibacter marisrubri]
MNQFTRSFAVLALGVLSAPALSQGRFNQNIMPLGDKEALMANTGTGGHGSSGAVYYNPAALTELEGSSFSFSGNAYFSFDFKADPLVTLGNDELDFEGAGYRSLPSSMIGTRSFGDWVVAFSLLVPYHFNYEGKNDWIINSPSNPYNITITQDYREEYFLGGLSTAKKLGNGWSLGLTLTGQYYYSLFTTGSNGYFISDPTIASISQSRQTLESYTLFGVVGIQKKWEDFALGLRVSSPSIRLEGSGDYYQYSYINDGSSPPTSSVLDLVGKKVHQKNPMDFRLGFSYQVSKKIFWAMDVAYAMEVTHDYYEGEAPVDPVSPENIRISTGLNATIKEDIDSYFGISYNPYKEVVNGEERQQSLVSVSGGSRLKIANSVNTIGLFYAVSGLESAARIGSEDSIQYQSYFGVSVGTTVQLDK